MKGLAAIPKTADLQKAYEKLQFSETVSNHELAVFSQFARFDPRVAELWIKRVSSDWRKINALQLRENLLDQPWPHAAGVLLSFVEKTAPHELLGSWIRLATQDFSRAFGEQFFIGMSRVGSSRMLRDTQFSTEEYRKWGYLGREALSDATPTLRKETRLQILNELLKTHMRITPRMYLEALNGAVSLRQAERDLKGCPFLRRRGNTKGCFYTQK